MTTSTRRFADNTAVRVIDRRRMLGFSGGMPFMEMEPGGSNQPRKEIGQGQLIIFKPRVDPNVDGDFKSAPVERAPQTFAVGLEFNFGIGAENDWGYRTLSFLTELDYDKETGWDQADEYFDAVHPKFSELNKTCDMGLEVLVFNDNDDVPRPCPTCRLAYLKSPECSKRMNESGLRVEILRALHDEITVCYTQARAFAQKKLDESKSEIEKARNGQPSLKTSYTDADTYYQKMLHRKEAHIEQAELIQEQSRQQGEAFANAMKGGSPDDGMTAAEKAEFWAWKAEKEKAAQSPATIAPESLVFPSEPIETVIGGETYAASDRVLCDALPGTVMEVKEKGWYAIALDNGDVKNVRKDSLKRLDV